jgi:cytochrome b subunit of formate dehydrogenase
MRPWTLILIGFLLSVSGVVLPFLMVLHTIPSTFFLNFFSYLASFTGLVLGVVGASLHVRTHRK